MHDKQTELGVGGMKRKIAFRITQHNYTLYDHKNETYQSSRDVRAQQQNLPNFSITTGKVRSDQKVGRFLFAENVGGICHPQHKA